jgi:hypothetical protein
MDERAACGQPLLRLGIDSNGVIDDDYGELRRFSVDGRAADCEEVVSVAVFVHKYVIASGR